jgi:hypothetical protein
MKPVLLVALALFGFSLIGFAEEANGLRLTAQKTLLEKNKDRDNSPYWDTVDKALGLKVNVRNVSLKDMPEGTLEYIVIVKRWGSSPTRYESYTGTEKLPALTKSAEANLTVAKVALGGYEGAGYGKYYQDTIEGWQLIAKHDGKETLKLQSTSSFDKLLPKAKPGKVEKK